MIIFRLIVFIAALIILSGQGWAQADQPVPTLEDFLGSADFHSAELSPSGDYVAGIRYIEDKGHFVVVLDLTSGEISAQPLGHFVANWIEWANEDRLLISLTGYKNYRTNKDLSPWEEWSKQTIPVSYTRLIATDRDGRNPVAMFGGAMSRNFNMSSVTSFLPNDDDHILMPARKGGDQDLFKVNVNTGEYERIAVGTNYTFAWFVDKNGEPAFRLNTNSRATVVTIYAREDRENGKIKWKKVRKIRLRRERKEEEDRLEFRPLGPGPEDHTYYVATRPDGEDTEGIYLYDLEKDEILETIKNVPGVDVNRAMFDRKTGDYLGAYYFRDRLVIELLNPEIQKHLNGLNQYFDNAANVFPIDSSDNGSKWLLFVDGPTQPGTYHVYDVEKAHALFIGVSKNSFNGKQLAGTEVVSYMARDGVELTGYLTRPAMEQEGVSAPLIMLPHGGPEVRDYVEFNYQVQFLASMGYQVFQPNFRGSSGFGQAFADMGRKEYGKAMQTDVEDGLHHLVQAGLADPEQVCIMGYSYGGYVAMAGATLTPDLYKCVIAGAGISDLVKMLRWERKEEGSDSESYKYWLKQVGHPRDDKEDLRSVSPALLADKVLSPILLIHGEQDYIVPIEQSEYMAKALKKAGKPVEFLKLENAGHSFRNDEEEEQEYKAIAAFLRKHLPVQTAAPTSSGE